MSVIGDHPSVALTRDRLLPPLTAGLVIWGIGLARAAVSAATQGEPVLLAMLITLPAGVYWLTMFPAILWLAPRLPLRRGRRLLSIAGHVAAASLVSALYAQLMLQVFTVWWPEPGSALTDDVANWAVRFQFGLFTYSFVLSWAYVHEYFTGMRQRDLAMARLETELAQAQLRALKAQLQPHFLFNTLHAVTVLIRHDPEAAGRMVMLLSDLLRMTLADAERQETTLEHELRFLRLYLEIERTRFQDRLEVCWEVAPGLSDAAVPTLLLQPLVENAIKHGLGARAGSGRVVISARREDSALVLQVSDNGHGLGGSRAPGQGLGLAATRGRLEGLYGSAHRFGLEENEQGGVSVTVGIPLRRLEGASRE